MDEKYNAKEIEEISDTDIAAEETDDSPCTSEEYYALPGGRGRRSLIFSLGSLVLAVLSIFLFVFYIPSIILSLGALALALISRRRLGYFDRLSLVGLTLSIFGLVFAVGALVLDSFGALDSILK